MHLFIYAKWKVCTRVRRETTCSLWGPIVLFASNLLWPSLWDCLSVFAWTSLQCSSMPSVFICLMHSFCLSGMPALTLNTRDLSVLKIIGKCQPSFSSAHSLQRRITLPPCRAENKKNPKQNRTLLTSLPRWQNPLPHQAQNVDSQLP